MTKEIPLTHGKVALVDDDDYERLIKWKWRYGGDGNSSRYACRTVHFKDGSSTCIFMHKEIMKSPEGFYLDHINRDKLDNRKSNLRIASPSQNVMNREKYKGDYTSKYKGVCYSKQNKTWILCVNGNYLGSFTDEIACANAYNYYAEIYQKEFAVFNDCPKIEDWRLYIVKDKKIHSIYKGVSWNDRVKKWFAYVIIPENKKMKNLGYFIDEVACANCYNHWAKHYYGDNAKLNDCPIVEDWECYKGRHRTKKMLDK